MTDRNYEILQHLQNEELLLKDLDYRSAVAQTAKAFNITEEQVEEIVLEDEQEEFANLKKIQLVFIDGSRFDRRVFPIEQADNFKLGADLTQDLHGVAGYRVFKTKKNGDMLAVFVR